MKRITTIRILVLVHIYGLSLRVLDQKRIYLEAVVDFCCYKVKLDYGFNQS